MQALKYIVNNMITRMDETLENIDNFYIARDIQNRIMTKMIDGHIISNSERDTFTDANDIFNKYMYEASRFNVIKDIAIKVANNIHEQWRTTFILHHGDIPHMIQLKSGNRSMVNINLPWNELHETRKREDLRLPIFMVWLVYDKPIEMFQNADLHSYLLNTTHVYWLITYPNQSGTCFDHMYDDLHVTLQKKYKNMLNLTIQNLHEVHENDD